jgi:DNA (cytosine-5)-methyltransferase 1
MNELHLFAGAGGGILGGILCGHRPVCAVEIEPYCRQVLLQRQRDGILPWFPIWDDVRTFDGKPWRGIVQILCGGFPCQDISSAGSGEGLEGARSGLWLEMARIIGEVEPEYVLVENSPMLTSRGLGRVLGDLAEMGYDARWGVLGANAAGACHNRARIWIRADSVRLRLQGRGPERARQRVQALVKAQAWEELSAPPTCGGNDAVANRVERTRALGNGQVPPVAALAWNLLSHER